MIKYRSWLACAFSLVLSLPCWAEDNPPSTQSLKDPSCTTATAGPATKPAPASHDGTSPGNTGSTGWSGGLGGSTIGTSQNGGTTASKSYQPATAQGLDPIAAPPKPVAANC